MPHLRIQGEVMVVNKREATPVSGCSSADCTECFSLEIERACTSCPKRDDLNDDVYGIELFEGLRIVDIGEE
jgi:hypothetical protein